MLYLEKPNNFTSKFDVVSCFIEYKGKVLILLKQDHKMQGNTWGMPAGKVNEEENPLEAIQREVNEETGLELQADKFIQVAKTYIKFPNYDYVYYLYKLILDNEASITINPEEHKAYQWLKPEEVLNLTNMMEDLDSCINLVYLNNITSRTVLHKTPEHDKYVLYFAPEIVKYIKEKKTYKTYRFGNRYEYLKPGDLIEIKENNKNKTISRARIKSVFKTTFDKLPLQIEGHETYKDKGHQRSVFSGYYKYLGREIEDNDQFLVINLEIIE